MDDFELNATGLSDAIRDFWENNPVVQAVKNSVDAVIDPIKFALNDVEKFVNSLKDYFDGLPFGRRLEELTPADMVHAYGLKDQAHRQLEQVRGRLLHADNDNARDSTKERLQLDVHRRLEAHLAERKLAARQLHADLQLVSISNLKVNITFTLDSRMVIKAQEDAAHLFALPTKSNTFGQIVPLLPTPFIVRLAGSFSVDVSLQVKVEGQVNALVHLVAENVGITFDLSSGANKRLTFTGDWGHTITLDMWPLSHTV